MLCREEKSNYFYAGYKGNHIKISFIMKVLDLRNENERKAYEAPLLKELGEVRDLTKGIKGSTVVDSEDLTDQMD